MERATGTEVYGCGSPQSSDITLNIQTTTGGNFSISLNGKNTVEHLKKIVSKKLKVSKDRICLLHRERQLRDGTLVENGLLDGSRVILLPSVETGLLSQRPENSVMQALESLNDTQVNDFLSGKSPLNLTMRLGDHMMLIQLQLSTLNSGATSGTRTLRTSTPTKTSSVRTKCESKDVTSHVATQKVLHCDESYQSNDKLKQSQLHVLQKKELDIIQNAIDLYQTMAEEKYGGKSELAKVKEEPMDSSDCSPDSSNTSLDNEQSPIKSLSNLVSNPIDVTSTETRESITNSVKTSLMDLLACSKLNTEAMPSTSGMCDKAHPSTSQTPDSSLSDDSDNFTEQSSFLAESTIDEYPMENLFNSAVDRGLFEEQDESMMDREISNLATTGHGNQPSTSSPLPSFQSLNEPLKNKRFQYLLHKTSKFKHPIGQNKQKAFVQSVVNKHKKRIQIQEINVPQPSTSKTEPFVLSIKKPVQVNDETEVTSTSKPFKTPDAPNKPQRSSPTPPIDTKTSLTSKQSPFKIPDAPKKHQRSSLTPSIDTKATQTPKQSPFKVPDAPRKPPRCPTPPVDTKALIEASKNLTQKLKKLSKEVLTNKIDLRTTEDSARSKIGPGAVIESMKHHGKGIYSGTFSGTLNPALQDRYGRPKRDISTIIHILNDLLCAAPPIVLSQKDAKHSCSGAIEDSSKCLGCSQPSCSYGQCDGHSPSTSKPCPCDHKACQCNRLDPSTCSTCENKPSAEICKKCDMAKMFALENSKTKCKLEQLRLVMQQKKQRREARKLKTLPYTPPKVIAAAEQPAKLQEEIETRA